MEKLLQLKGINKAFNGVQVLFNIDLELYSGEILCLVGENGAGKSTLIKILSGAEAPGSGTIEALEPTKLSYSLPVWPWQSRAAS